jgi:mannose-6-phosphate isomerase-like protein (cupin superfamily)
MESTTETPRPTSFILAGEMVKGSPLPGWSGRFFHSEHLTVAHWDIAQDAADLHEHDHVQEEVWNVVDGEIAISVGGEERILGPGDAAVLAPNARHSVRVLGPCRAIVADYPVRHHLPGVPSSSVTER